LNKNDDENLDLASLEKKGKFKKISSGESTSQYGQEEGHEKIQVLLHVTSFGITQVSVQTRRRVEMKHI
jgi:competence protein ComGF